MSYAALFGHSAGGTLAPLVARDLNVAEIAVAGAMGSNFIEYIVAMRDRERALEGRSKQGIAQMHAVTQACLARLLEQGQSPDAIEAAHPECKKQVRFDSPTAFTRQWHQFDLSEAWSHVKAPVLVFYGTGDFVTSEFESQTLVVRVNSMAQPKKPRARYRALPMDHGFLAHEDPKSAWEAERGKRTQAYILHSMIDELVSFFGGAK